MGNGARSDTSTTTDGEGETTHGAKRSKTTGPPTERTLDRLHRMLEQANANIANLESRMKTVEARSKAPSQVGQFADPHLGGDLGHRDSSPNLNDA